MVPAQITQAQHQNLPLANSQPALKSFESENIYSTRQILPNSISQVQDANISDSHTVQVSD